MKWQCESKIRTASKQNPNTMNVSYIPSIYTQWFCKGNVWYLYNAQSNFLSEVSDELIQAVDGRDWDSLPQPVMDMLIKHHIIEKEGELYDYFDSELVRFNAEQYDLTVLNLVIAPTTACNFDCPYCFESKRNPKTISDDTIRKLGDFVRSFDNAKKMRITWYGGEPLMALSKIRKIYALLTEEGMPEIAHQSIITNGYLFDEEAIDYFVDNKLNQIQITLDGIGKAHDQTRCLKNSDESTFDRIYRNIRLIAEKMPDTDIHIRVNVDKQSFTKFLDVYAAIKRDFPDNKRIKVYPGLIKADDETGCSLSSSCYQSDERHELYSSLRQNGFGLDVFPKRSSKGCMMQGIASFLIGPEGELYKCWNDIGKEEKVIGTVDSKKLKHTSLLLKYLLHSSSFNEECRECKVFPVCEGGCGYDRYRNRFEGGRFSVCTHLKKPEILEEALLSRLSAQNQNK